MDYKSSHQHKIIEDSIRVMYLKGYNATSVNDLVQAAGIPKGSFYYYFKTKEAYALEALKFYMEEMGGEKFAIFDIESIKALDRIRKFYEMKIEAMKDEAYKMGCFLGNLSQEMADVNEDISKVTNEMHQEVVGRLLRCLKEAEDEADFQPILDVATLAEAINNGWQGALVRMKSSRNNEPLEAFYRVLDQVYLKNKCH